MQEKITFTLNKFTSLDKLDSGDQQLLSQAREATKLSYSPYSNFKVGAAAKLSNGEIVVGSNQENASYGATLCAERVLLATISTLAPLAHIITLAVSYTNSNGQDNRPISPCGICRQALLEHQMFHNQPFRIIMAGFSGEIWLVDSITSLLPLAFSSDDLK